MRIQTILSMILIILELLISESMALTYDKETFVKKTFIHLDKKEWQDCEKMAKASNDQALIKIVLSQKFLDQDYKKNSFEEVIKFIQNNPHWSQVDKLKEKAEQYLNYDTNKTLIINWFSKNEPITALGYKFYALASRKLIKDQQKLAKIIKNGWIYGVFTAQEEKDYLTNFKNILGEEDHVKKIDQYLWEADINSAKKYMHYVSNGYKQNFIAQIAILNQSSDSEKLFKKLSEKYYTPALLFHYLDFKKKEIPNSKSIDLFKKVKLDIVNSGEFGARSDGATPISNRQATSDDVTNFSSIDYKRYSARWGRLQSYYAREFIDQKDFANSYKIISMYSNALENWNVKQGVSERSVQKVREHAETPKFYRANSSKQKSMPLTVSHEHIREAEWLSGWLALRFLDKPDLALSHFNKFMTVATKPLSISRGQYWLARTYQAKGDMKQANKFYNMAGKYSHLFYGQLANIELKKNHIILAKKPKSIKSNIENSEIIRAIEHLIKYGKYSLAFLYADTAIRKSSEPSEILLITNIISSYDNIFHMVEISRIACQQHVFIKDYAFPIIHRKAVKNAPIEAALIYGIIRHESGFNQYAINDAKGYGLMQLEKAAACDTAKSLNHQCHIKKLTTDPEYNIMLGSNYLKEMLQQFDGSYLLSIAAYNAGPNTVLKWIDRFGDPRNLKNLWQIIDWMELIPYSQTRNYVQRVLENIQVYRTILNKNNNLKLKQDLLT